MSSSSRLDAAQKLDPITAQAQRDAVLAFEARLPMDEGERTVVIVTVVAMAILFSFGLCCGGLEFTGHMDLTIMQGIKYLAAPIIGGAILTAAIVGLIYLFGDKTLQKIELHSLENDPLSGSHRIQVYPAQEGTPTDDSVRTDASSERSDTLTDNLVIIDGTD